MTYQKINSDFSLTEKVKDWIGNDEWVESFNDMVTSPNLTADLESNDAYLSLWYFLSASIDKSKLGGELYEKTVNYVQNVVDVETCEINALRSLAHEIGVKEYDFYDISFPKEIEKLINIFSISQGKVMRQSSMLTDSSWNSIYSIVSGGSATFPAGVMSGYYDSTLVSSTPAADFLKNAQTSGCFTLTDQTYLDSISAAFYGTLETYCNMYTDLNMSIPRDDADIEDLKIEYGVDKTFYAKKIVNDIQYGIDKVSNYSQQEQEVLLQEIANRAVITSGKDTTNRYLFEKQNMVRVYRGFVESLYLDSSTFNISGDLIYLGASDNTTTYSASTSATMLNKAADILTNMCINLTYYRENLKNVCFKYAIAGTGKLVETVVFEYLARHFNSQKKWRMKLIAGQNEYFGETSANIPVLGDGDVQVENLLRKVEAIEYYDWNNYLNIEQTDDQNYITNPRYWTGEELEINQLLSEHSQSEIDAFYSRLGFPDYDAVSAFVDSMYALGATSGSVLTEATSSVSYPMYAKYSGVSGYGDFVPFNVKNINYSSWATIPFLWSLTEKAYNLMFDKIYTNCVLYADELEIARLMDRYNNSTLSGSAKNGWKSAYDEYTGYMTYYEYSNNLNIRGNESKFVDCDGPWIPEALSSFLSNTNAYTSGVTAETNIYFDQVELTDYDRSKIYSQCVAYSGYIQALSAKTIYQYGCDLYGNHYTLFKNNDDFDEAGQLWMRLKNHPLSFPLLSGDNNSFEYSQLNVEGNTGLEAVQSNLCYDFGLFDNKLWMFCGTSPITGSCYMFNVQAEKRYEEDDRLVFNGQAMFDSFVKFVKPDSNKFIGVFKNKDEISMASVSVSAGKSLTPYVEGGKTYYNANIDINNYSDTNIEFESLNLKFHYDEFWPVSAQSGQYIHNNWKLAYTDDKVTIAYEYALPLSSSQTFTQVDSRAFMWENGDIASFDTPVVTNFDVPLNEQSAAPGGTVNIANKNTRLKYGSTQGLTIVAAQDEQGGYLEFDDTEQYVDYQIQWDQTIANTPTYFDPDYDFDSSTQYYQNGIACIDLALINSTINVVNEPEYYMKYGDTTCYVLNSNTDNLTNTLFGDVVNLNMELGQNSNYQLLGTYDTGIIFRINDEFYPGKDFKLYNDANGYLTIVKYSDWDTDSGFSIYVFNSVGDQIILKSYSSDLTYQGKVTITYNGSINHHLFNLKFEKV